MNEPKMGKDRLETFSEYNKRTELDNQEKERYKVIKKRKKVITSVSLAVYAMALLYYVAFTNPEPDKTMYNDYITMERMEKIIELIHDDPNLNNPDFPIEKLVATLYERGLLYGSNMDEVVKEARQIIEIRKKTDDKQEPLERAF